MPDGSYKGFDTLKREESFRFPSEKGHTVPILQEFVTPHIQSFNALFDDSGLPMGDGDGKGLLSLSLRDIAERVVFDYTGPPDADGKPGLGHRMSSECSPCLALADNLTDFTIVRIDAVSISRPMLSSKDKAGLQKLYPSEVRSSE